MTKKVKNSAPKKLEGKAAPTQKTSRKICWRIFRFKQRFELPGYCRKSGLRFTRDFVITSGNEALGYQNQFALLANGDGCDYAQIYGIYRLLVNMAAKRSKTFRGYLLDARNQPLSNAQISRLLNIQPNTMNKFLRRLEKVNLIEWVELPDFAEVAR